MDKDKVTMSIRIDKDVYDRLRYLKDNHGISINWIVSTAITRIITDIGDIRKDVEENK